MISPPQHSDFSRRTLIKGAGSVFATALVANAFARDTAAQEVANGRLFLNGIQADTVDAIAEVMWPPTDASVGGSDAGVMFYIDRALAGPYSDYQDVYVAGLEWVDYAALLAYEDLFGRLEFEQQVDVITRIYDGDLGEISSEEVARSGHALIQSSAVNDATPGASPIAEELATPIPTDATPATQATPQPSPAASGLLNEGPEDSPLAFVDGMVVAGIARTQVENLREFIDIVRVHVMEGLFSDPVYGGNRGFGGWSAVGYPGPYVVYTAEQQESFEPLNLPMQSIADL